jgi:RNA-directed DNA polymerase
MSLGSDMQQNIQMELNFSVPPMGEAREAGREETESLPTIHAPERPAGTIRLMEEICDRENLTEALRRVKANKGSAGIDGMTVGDLADHLKQHWPAIRERLLSGTYEPYPVRRVEIPKPDGGVRTLGIPTVLDRMIQQAVMRFYRGSGMGHFPITATGSDQGGRPIKQWLRRSGISLRVTAGALISIWRNSSIESITTN